MRKINSLFRFSILAIISLLCVSARAGGVSFNTAYGAETLMQEMRWPYPNGSVYNPCFYTTVNGENGAYFGFYMGNLMPNAAEISVGLNFSIWGIGNPIQPGDNPIFIYSATNAYPSFSTGESVAAANNGVNITFRTNQWHRYVLALWQPADGTPHRTYMGGWIRFPDGTWWHYGTLQIPFAGAGFSPVMGFQENLGSTTPWRSDYRNSYYHHGGTWHAANLCAAGANDGWLVNASVIENGTAASIEACPTNNPVNYVGIPFTNSIPLLMSNQPAQPTFDPILVTNTTASVYGSQLLVQWQVPPTSSPQLGYKIEVFNNANYTGSASITFFDRDPEIRLKLLDISGVVTPYVRVTISDIFHNTNEPALITPSAVALNPATNVVGAVSGLGYSYYQSTSNYLVLPNFNTLTPVQRGVVNYPDLTPRLTRNDYAFNYNGFINVPSNGIYVFTLNSYHGSKLLVDGALVVDNDGQHSLFAVQAPAALAAGRHAINVQYFMDYNVRGRFNDTLTLSYEGPGIPRTMIPDSAYFRVPGGSEPTIALTAPANDDTLCGSNVTMNASVTSNGVVPASVQFFVGNSYYGQAGETPYSINAFLGNQAANSLRARLVYSGGYSLDSPAVVFATTNMDLGLWTFAPLQWHRHAPAAKVVGNRLTMVGDMYNLLVRQVTGDCTLVARLAGLPVAAAPDGSTPDATWCGIILRANTNTVVGHPLGGGGACPYAAVFGTTSGTYFEDSTMEGGAGDYHSPDLGTINRWFKVARAGDTFTSYVSVDGANWRSVNTKTLAGMGTTLYAGMFTYTPLTQNPTVPWGTLDNLSLSGNVVGLPDVTVTPISANLFSGQSATLTANTIGNPSFIYQWLVNGVVLPGATNASFTLTNAQPGNSGNYTVVVSNAAGVATSSGVSVVVMTPPAGSTVYPTLVVSNAPYAYWRLNETSGTTAFDSVSAKDGTYANCVLGGAGPQPPSAPGLEATNRAPQFNGTSSRISCGTAPSLNGPTDFTVMAWVKTTSDSSGVVIQQRDYYDYVGEYQLALNSSGAVTFFIFNTDYQFILSSRQKVNDGQWHQIAGVRSGTTGYLYIDGQLAESGSGAVQHLRSGLATCIGFDQRDLISYFNGSIDEVAVFKKALSGATIQNLYQTGTVPPPSLISLSTPATGMVFAPSDTIPLTATVTTNGHSVVKVQFYNGITLLGEDTAAPYSLNWTNVFAGNHTVFAQMVYDGTNVMSSTPAFITVLGPPAAPQNLTALGVASNQINLAWSPSAYAYGYVIFRDGTPVGSSIGTTFSDTGLAMLATYCYTVTATNPFFASTPSTSACAMPPPQGESLSWDADSLLAGVQDGSGNWLGGTNWWYGAGNMAWTDGNIAVFGTNTMTNCTVTVSANLTPSGITFNRGGYTIVGAGQILLSGTSVFTANNHVTVGTVVGGTGTLLKVGAGNLTLSKANTYTGGTVINEGTLNLGGGGGISGTIRGTATVNTGGTLQLSTTDAIGYGGGNTALTAINLVGGTLNVNTTANQTLGSAVINLIGGSITGNSAGNIDFYGGNSTLNTFASSTTANISGVPLSPLRQGSTTFNVAAGTTPSGIDLDISSVLRTAPSGNAPDAVLTKSGLGTMQLSGANTFGEPITVSGGTLLVSGSLGTNTVTVNGGATLGGNGTIAGTVAVSGAIAPGTNSVDSLSTGAETWNPAGSYLCGINNTNATGSDKLAICGSLNIQSTTANPFTIKLVSLTSSNTPGAVAGFNKFTDYAWTNATTTGGILNFAANKVALDTSSFSSEFSGGTFSVGVSGNSLVIQYTRALIPEAPQIVTQPETPVALYVGDTITLSVEVTGAEPILYQWTKDGVELEGATSKMFVKTVAQVSDSGLYAVKVTNPGGTVTSSNAVVTVTVPTLWQILEVTPELSTLKAAVETAGLVETLAGAEALTLFTPNNTAFEALPAGVWEALLANPELLLAALTYHALAGTQTTTELVSGDYETLNGASVTVVVTNVVMVNDSEVIEGDLLASNGVAHVIDAVLLLDPPQIMVRGDLDGDGEVDRADLDVIVAARNTAALGPEDPRDLDGDGMITVLDARILVTLFTVPAGFTRIASSPEGVVLEWNENASVMTLQSTSDLRSGLWEDVGGVQSSTNTVIGTSAERMFFRLVLPE